MRKIAVLCFTFCSFSIFADAVNPATSLIRAARLLARADLTCKSVSDCEVVSLGHRACGGPASYEVLSKLNANYEETLFIAASSEEKGRIYNQENGIISICSLVAQPAVTCVKNLCTTK